ncbi:MAG: hypothetical protein WKG07_36000 [Hymenobacter sp.]
MTTPGTCTADSWWSPPPRGWSTQNIALSAVGREAIMGDEHFAGGDYYDTPHRPDAGLRVARMTAHITYVPGPLAGREVRPAPPARRRAALRPPSGVPGRELPRSPGRQLPAALRRELVPSTWSRGHGLLRPVR